METLFQLINLYATAPRLDPVYFSNYETSLRSTAETRADQPDAVFSDAVNTRCSARHHFRRRPLTLELLDELSLERAEAVSTRTGLRTWATPPSCSSAPSTGKPCDR